MHRLAERSDLMPQVELRAARPDDALLLRRLAGLDSAAPLELPALLAFVDGEPVAARSLLDGRSIADPFRPTAHVRELLAAAA